MAVRFGGKRQRLGSRGFWGGTRGGGGGGGGGEHRDGGVGALGAPRCTLTNMVQ